MFTTPVLSEKRPPNPARSIGIESLKADPKFQLEVNCEYCSFLAMKIIINNGAIITYFFFKKLIKSFI